MGQNCSVIDLEYLYFFAETIILEQYSMKENGQVMFPQHFKYSNLETQEQLFQSMNRAAQNM